MSEHASDLKNSGYSILKKATPPSQRYRCACDGGRTQTAYPLSLYVTDTVLRRSGLVTIPAMPTHTTVQNRRMRRGSGWKTVDVVASVDDAIAVVSRHIGDAPAKSGAQPRIKMAAARKTARELKLNGGPNSYIHSAGKAMRPLSDFPTLFRQFDAGADSSLRGPSSFNPPHDSTLNLRNADGCGNVGIQQSDCLRAVGIQCHCRSFIA